MTLPAAELLAAGLLATLLATLRLYSWIAVGLALRAAGFSAGSATRSGVALLAGACLTMVVYASLSAAGMLAAAVGVDAMVAAWALARTGREAGELVRGCASLLVPPSRNGRIALAAIGSLLWIVAIGPPRDGDVMHYHLAHVRQIIASGIWRQLPICSYGIPFGWSLTYLPFEWARLPQGAHLLNLGAWALVSALCVEIVAETVTATSERAAITNAAIARALLAGTSLLPVVMKAATTAMADAFTMLVVALVLALLVVWPRLEQGGTFALGFVAFAGLSTRYQAAGVAIAITLIVFVDAIPHPSRRRLLLGYSAGAAAACLASSPFYLANAITLGAPLWPFGVMIQRSPGSALPANDVAELAVRCVSRALAGDWRARLAAVGRLLIDRTAFPIPLFLLAGCGATVAWGSRTARRVGTFVFLFVGIWALAQPRLEPRFAAYLVFAAVVCVVPSVKWLIETRFAPVVRVAGGVAIGALSIVGGIYSLDYMRLAVTGDVARFHHATWYWSAYDWANHNTPTHSRFVVVLYGGNTYSLDRWNVSGDPGSSAAVPWGRIGGGCDLEKFLRSMRVDFVFYGPNVWNGESLDARAATAITEAMATGTLVERRRFDIPIVYGRMERLERRTTVTLFRVDSAAGRNACRGR